MIPSLSQIEKYFKVSYLPKEHVLGQWEETREPQIKSTDATGQGWCTL